MSADTVFQDNLGLFSDQRLLTGLKAIRRGLEREVLRVDSDGALSRRPHPASLGSALCHPWITTDFSEAMLELVTPPSRSLEQMIKFNEQLLALAADACSRAGETLWAASLPCWLDDSDSNIPLADYGSSHSGKMKSLYRRGLSCRYGSRMQMVAGIHYNFSLPPIFWKLSAKAGNSAKHITVQEHKNSGYMNLVRNCQRYSWLLVQLFGASPVLHHSFLKDREHKLQRLPSGDYSHAGATSLRLSQAGYLSADQQNNLSISTNSLGQYISGLLQAINKQCPGYFDKGLYDKGQRQQLNTSILQIENEYYGVIRPKRLTLPGSPLLKSLASRGIEYVELRLLDIDPLEPFGFNTDCLYFIETFLLYCLLSESPEFSESDRQRHQKNLNTVVLSGRVTNIRLNTGSESRKCQDWGTELIRDIQQVAEILDRVHGGKKYLTSCQLQLDKLHDPSLLPSARLLQAMNDQQSGCLPFIMDRSRKYTAKLQGKVTGKMQQKNALHVAESVKKQHELELQSAQRGSLNQYIDDFYLQYEHLKLSPEKYN